MQTVMTNRDVELRVESSIIYTTDSKAFWRSGNQLIMNYEQAQELFGIKFRRWLGIFNL